MYNYRTCIGVYDVCNVSIFPLEVRLQKKKNVNEKNSARKPYTLYAFN